MRRGKGENRVREREKKQQLKLYYWLGLTFEPAILKCQSCERESKEKQKDIREEEERAKGDWKEEDNDESSRTTRKLNQARLVLQY